MLNNLSQPTPKKGTLLWFIMTILYVFTIIVNEHFELLEAFNFNAQTISTIKLLGTIGYILSTLGIFNQTPKNNESPPK